MLHADINNGQINWYKLMKDFRNSVDNAMTLHFQEPQDDIEKYISVIYLTGKRNGMTLHVFKKSNKKLIVLKQYVKK